MKIQNENKWLEKATELYDKWRETHTIQESLTLTVIDLSIDFDLTEKEAHRIVEKMFGKAF